MQVNFDPTAAPVQTEKRQPAPPAKPSQNKAPEPTPRQKETVAPSPNITYGGLLESNVTFRRDTNGQIYYVITDAKSGKELRQVPTEEIRKTGEGIAEYLKRAQEKSASSHVELKA